MLLKRVVTSLITTVSIFLLCSTYSYADINNTKNMKSDLKQSLTEFEEVFSNERSHYNLDDNDTISNNLELGEVYQNNTINIDADTNTKDLSKKLKKSDYYVGTVKLKDSNKPIALAYIQKEDSKWVIFRVNSYNSLDTEIENYKKNVNANPIIINDESKGIFAIGSKENNNTIKIIKSNSKLNLKNGQFKKISELQSELKVMKEKYTAATTQASAAIGGAYATTTRINTFNYTYLIIPIIFSVAIIIFFIISKKRSKYNKLK